MFVYFSLILASDADRILENDRQAEDRCHRIGQEKPVMVYRLICEHTVEEYILQRAKEKLALNNAILDEGGMRFRVCIYLSVYF